MTQNKIKPVLQLVLSIVIVELVGFCSSLLAGDIAGKYEALNKAPLSPPGAVFGPVWIVLYLLMGISIFLIIRTNTDEKSKRNAVGIFVVQLALNFLWSILFFGGSSFWFAAVIILLLDAAVITCIVWFKKLSTLAAGLMVPYLLWILFATYLNIAFAIIN